MSTSSNRPVLPLVGIDWGTTNRRAYLFNERGEVVRTHADELGILSVGGNFEASLAALLDTLGLHRADVIMSGMVGSRNGWVQVPYLTVATPLSQLAEAMMEVPTRLRDVRVRIAPGYRYDDPQGTPDVMRGEETQVLGALAMSAPDGWFLLPGTHSKWTHVRDGVITEFSTFMTGELFGLLTKHGTLAALMQVRQDVPDAFEAGLRASAKGSFTHTAFGCRALTVTDSMPAAHAWSYLSGLLIGSEINDIRGRKSDASGKGEAREVQIIGSPELERLYAKALAFFGMSSRAWQPNEVFVAAVRRLANIRN